MIMGKRKGAVHVASDRQAAFVREYIIDLNATQAALRAGYSPHTAAKQGSRLLQYAEVAAAIAAEQQKRAERTRIDADWVLTTLAEEKTADLAALYDDAGNLRPMREWPMAFRRGLVVGVETVHGDDGSVVRKVRLSDRVRHMEMIGKHVDVQAFSEQMRHSGTLTLEQLVAQSYGKGKPG